MTVQIINKTKSRLPQKFIKSFVLKISRKLKKHPLRKMDLTIAFVSSKGIQKLNHQFLGKNKPTDILSFSPIEDNSIGELVLCLPILKKQARDHKLSLNEEIGYMLIHGILHLLGYEHEKSRAKAKKMFKIQDELFNELM